jgi:uncharacterized protein (TIGR00730 family)
MGAVALAAHAGGAPVIGVVPRFLYELERAQDAPPQEHVITNDMSERKRYMLNNSDAFLALPGGYGTVDEVLDVVSMQTLGQLDKQCVLLDPDGVWKHLVRLLEELPRRGFADPVVGGLLQVATTPEAAFDLIESHPAVLPAAVSAHRGGHQMTADPILSDTRPGRSPSRMGN